MAQVRRVQARTDDKHAATADGESTVRCDDGHAFGACVGLRGLACEPCEAMFGVEPVMIRSRGVLQSDALAH